MVAAKTKEKTVALSYHQLFAQLKGCKDYDILSTACPKPSKAAQAQEPGAHRIWGTDIYAHSEHRPLLNIDTKEISPHQAKTKNSIQNVMRFALIAALHAIALHYGPR
jgi:hypothetical protein